MKKKKSIANTIWIVILTIAALAWIYPIIMILMNSLKKESAISTGTAFKLPTADAFAGIANYVDAVASKGFLSSLGYSTFITITSVVAILVCCSMCAWYITRVNSPISKILYYLFVFSMVVPFQMVMFTMVDLADKFHLRNPLGMCILYLGFGAGLSVFMFSGFVKSIPLEIEEAAMIDGCNPLQTYFRVVFPILKPTAITVAILNVMWIWNDFLLPYLVIGISTRYKTIPVVIQMLVGTNGNKDLGALMAMLVLSIVPIVIFYMACQKYIIEGVVAGAVKG